MALTSPIRLQFLVATTAEFATDDFNKRAGFNTTVDAWRIKVAGVERVTAMRDASQTFQGLQIFAAGVQDSTLTANRLMFAGASGRHSGSAKLTVNTSGVANIIIGDGVAAETSALSLDSPAGNDAFISLRSANVSRWFVGREATTLDFLVKARDSLGADIDKPIDIVNAAAGLITIGGSTARATNFTGAIQTSGVTRISSGGAGTLTTLSTTGLATLAQATVSDIAATQVMFGGTAGRVTGNANMTFDTAAGVAVLTVGSAALANVARLSLDTAAGYTRYIRIRTGTVGRWAFGGGAQTETGVSNAGTDFELLALTDVGATIDTPLSIVRAAGGAMTVTRPLRLTTQTADRVLTTGASGEVTSDAGWLVTRVGGITRRFTLGDGAVAGFVGGLIRRSPGSDSGFAFREDVAAVDVSRWELRHQNSDGNLVIGAYGTNGVLIDLPISLANASAGVMTFGGTTARPANFTGAIQTSGVQRISGAGAASFTTLSTTGLATLAQATVSDIAADRIVTTTTGGRLMGDAGLTRTALSGVTRTLFIGDNSVAGNTTVTVRRTSSYFAGYLYQDSGTATRWSHTYDDTIDWILSAYTSGAMLIDNPISIANASAGLITLGGTTLRPVNFTGAIQTSGVQRISAAGAASFTTLSTTGLATLAQATVSDLTSGRMVSTTTAGRLQALDAAASRTLIGIGDATGGAITVVQDASVAPPGSPVVGVPYLVGIGATGAWASQDDKLATWSGSAWSFASRASIWTMCFNATGGTLLTNVDGSGNKLVFLPSLVCSGNIQGATVAGSNADFSGVYKASGTQVVSTRKTGWAAATGTATRSTFATGSVTTTQLAERVKALIDDLISHGLIGA